MRCAEIVIVLLTIPLALAGVAGAQEKVDFAGAAWETQGDVVLAEDFEGRRALRFRSGSARLVDAVFESGTVAFDVRTTGHRSFVGFGFRAEGADREDFYLRPHNTGRFDAMQYTPVYHGDSGWQLYPEDNATFDIPTDRWLHVQLVIAGPRLDVYLDGAAEPVLSVPRLRRGRTRGEVFLWASFPGGEPADLYPNAFADFVLRPDDGEHEYPPEPVPAADSGLVGQWSVSASFPVPDDPETLPRADGGWQTVAAGAEGRLNLARYVGFPEGARGGTVLAGVVLASDAARVVRLGFGFSDRATVFLDGRPVFRGDNTYRSRSGRYLGVMRVDNDVLYLALKQGRNELVFAVSEAFGGWGVTARLIDRDGVSVGPLAPAE
jgi:hypothetical protein